MINVQQNEKEYTISVTIPFKKVAFSETPYKRDFKEFAEKVFGAYTIVIVQAIRARMKACTSNLIKHSDSTKYCDDKYITGGEHTFSFNAYETMRVLVKKVEQYKLSELTKFELKQIAKAWVENKVDIREYTFQDLIDVIDEYRELK
ncbi:MAG: hypothetical protein [Bacteriophage sp.]|nr:MAG: hypothetical protein [Bacteriophage sp.]